MIYTNSNQFNYRILRRLRISSLVCEEVGIPDGTDLEGKANAVIFKFMRFESEQIVGIVEL